MKYLCLIYQEESRMASLSDAERGLMMADYDAFTKGIASRGALLGGEGLQPTATATTIRVRDGRATVVDGPFAETKEQLGGFFLIDASDLDEAVRIASDIPGARFGCVEVRPVMMRPKNLA